MKSGTISAEALFESHREAMRWEWVAGHAHPERHFEEAAIRDARSAADLVGYLNYIHPYRVQIVGRREVAYLNEAQADDQERRISRIVTLEPPVIIVADGETPPSRLIAMCDRAEIPLFVTQASAGHVIDVVRAELSQRFAERTTLHGVFLDILGLGVLLTGESGLGKSELGLELVSRGHGLVADGAGGSLSAAAHQPAGGARHRPLGYQGHLWRDRCPAQDAAEADRPLGTAGNHGA
jgi:HPr kinase/phosphorylase